MVRSRHPRGAYKRETHLSTLVNFGAPTDALYGSQMDLESVTVVDIGAGSVTDGAVVPGGLTGGTVIMDGSLPARTYDQTPPALPTSISVSSEITTDADSRSLVAIKVTFIEPTDDDYFATYVEITNLSDGDPVTPSPVWTNPIITFVGKGTLVSYTTGVAGNTQYWVRMRSCDVQGNRSDPSGVFSVLTLADLDAPSIPSGVVCVGGYRGLGARWTAVTAIDLMTYELRYAPDNGAGTAPTSAWVYLKTRANVLFIDNLDPSPTSDHKGKYWVQVRAVDYSQNVTGTTFAITGNSTTDVFTTSVNHTFIPSQAVRLDDLVGGTGLDDVTTYYILGPTSNTFQLSLTPGGAAVDFSTDVTAGVVFRTPNAIHNLSYPEDGWSPLVGPVQTQYIGASDVAFNSVMTNILAANKIDANTITTGTLKMNLADSGMADGLRFYYSGKMVAYWDEGGLYMGSLAVGLPVTPSDALGDLSSSSYMKLTDAGLTVYKAGSARAAINTDGINATAITFGALPGGHNLLQNSSFELCDFAVASTPITWDVQANWTATELSNTNATNGANSVTITGSTY